MLDFRDHRRAVVVIEVRCRIGARRFSALVRDLSGIGCFLSTEERCRVGVAIELVFEPPGFDGPRLVPGEVIRLSGSKDDHVGMGVAFLDPLTKAAAAGEGDLERLGWVREF